MISVRVRDFRGCERADLEIDPVALIGGRNGAGKTSIAQAVGAAAYGNALPMAGLARGSAGVLIRVGQSSAFVELRGESGTTRIDWPAAQATSDGTPPAASEYAAGLSSVPSLDAKDRARVLATYLHADPTREDLAIALAETPLAVPAVIEQIWKLIEQHGWDGAHQLRREKGAELKGRWRQITGAHYGSRVATSWRPDLIVEDTATDADLVAAVNDATAAHNRAVGDAAVAAVDRERLAAEAATIDERNAAVGAAESELQIRTQALDAAQQARMALPPDTSDKGAEMPCPHCGGLLVLRRVSLVETRLEQAPVGVDPVELKRRRLAIADADGAIANATDALNMARRNATAARDQVRTALKARESLDSAPKPSGSSGSVEAARSALATAERRLAAFRQRVEAEDVAAKIAGNDILLEHLAADGLRARKLSRVLDVFNASQLAPLCDAAGWKAVAVDPAMTITYGGRAYPLLSSSEQYRVRVVLQITMARLDQSSLVVIDAADILDAPLRSGLFDLIADAGVPAIVCMTLSRREQTPDLAAAGLGRSYWIEAGIVEPIAQPREAAA
jgi:hypothetical protein